MSSVLYRLGHFSVRYRRFVLPFWILLLVGVIALGSALGGETSGGFTLPGTESQRAFDLLDERFPAQSGSTTRVVFAVEAGGSLEDPDVAASIAGLMDDIALTPGVEATSVPTSAGSISPDGLVGFGEIRYAAATDDIGNATLDAVAADVEAVRATGFTVEFGGDVIPAGQQAQPASELIGVAVAVVVLLVSFGSVIAMGLPLLTAVLGLAVGLSGITIMTSFVDLSEQTSTLATMIGLAVGIDYALFIITRHREHLAEGLGVEEAAARANATAGGAVVFAGMTVVIALVSLAASGMPFLTAMGLGAAGTVAVAVLVAISLMPAMLGFAGHNIDRFRVPGLKNRTGAAHEGETLGARWARKVTGHPVLALVGGSAVMLVLAVPMLSMRLGLPDDGTESPATTQRRAYDLLADGFGPGFNGPLVLVVDLDGAADPTGTVDQLAAALPTEPGVVAVDEPSFNDAGDAAVIGITPTTGPTDEATEQLIRRLRDDVLPPIEQASGAEASLTGSTAANIDISAELASSLPTFIAIVLGLTILLLLLVFRSILVPLKAAIAILLSIGASFGVIVAMFQWGWLQDVIGLDTTSPIINFLPTLMFAIVFGLSMDYEVFILSRIHEDYARTGDAKRSVVTGIGSSARVITAAALIMISVFGAFVLGDETIIQMFGVGLSVAVFLDATVVRMLIVPGVMTLFDKAAWWIPRWLDRAMPNLDVEGARLVATLEAPDAADAADAADEREPALQA
jgi:putative drug exporter of the RND superfamily